MITASHRIGLLLAAACLGSAAQAQQGGAAATVVAVPPLSTPADRPTPAGSTLAIAWQASQLIAQDLRTTSEIMPVPPVQKDYYSYPERRPQMLRAGLHRRYGRPGHFRHSDCLCRGKRRRHRADRTDRRDGQ
jgi:hypothetical protein